MLVIIGLPVFFTEMILGQYSGLSATKVFSRMTRGMRGLGYGMTTIPLVTNLQYVMIQAYAMFFLFAGMKSSLPWATCMDSYNTEHCYSVEEAKACNSSETFYNKTCMPGAEFCALYNYDYNPEYNSSCVSNRYILNTSAPIPFQDVTYRVSSSEDYWYNRVLHLAFENGHLDTTQTWWDNWGSIRWDVTGCLFGSWVIICICLIQGIHSLSKVVYFITLFPYVVLTIMLGYVITLDGFEIGLEFYIIPKDFEKLLDLNVWYVAATQIFYSLSVGSGAQLMLASYNGFRNNCHRDALLIGACNSLTSIYAGFSVFGVIGFLAKTKNVGIDDVVTQGPDLAFIVYPEALTQMAAAPFFSFLFFFMLNLLALSSVCGSHEAVITAFIDEFPKYKSKRPFVTIFVCFISFLGGLAMCFDSGFLLFVLMDARAGNAMLMMALFEIIVAQWFYGTPTIFKHLREMEMWMPKFLKYYWYACWMVVTPGLLLIVTIMAWVNWEPNGFADAIYPPGVQFMGWGLELFGTAVFIFFAIWAMVSRKRKDKSISWLKSGIMMQPTPLWGPRKYKKTLIVEELGSVNSAFDDSSSNSS